MYKSFVLLVFTASLACAADFLTGQAARAVMGQTTFTENVSGNSDTRMGALGGLAFVNDTLFVADSNRMGFQPLNHRVVIFTGMGQALLPAAAEIPPETARCPLCFGQASVVIGQSAFQPATDLRSRILALANASTSTLLTVDQWDTYRNQILGPFDSSLLPALVTATGVAQSTPINIDKYIGSLVAVGLQDTSTPAAPTYGSGPDRMRLPVGVASDGIHLAVADTSNNRVLLWNSIPTINGQPADVVLGQSNFTNVRPGLGPSSMRGPQGVWFQNGMLFVADTQNNRILIWRSVPQSNGQAADLVLGQPNFNTSPPINILNTSLTANASTMLSPTSVTSDGTHVFVTDLGYNRVLIWNSIPNTNQQAADVVVGQINFSNTLANATSDLCASTGTDSNGNPTYPSRCAATLNFPRFALSDGTRLFIADGGNDRVLVFNQIPTQAGARADAVLGQTDEFASGAVSSNDQQKISAANQTPTPTSLAWDGQNLYVADATDYRVLIFTPATPLVAIDGVVNSASRAIYANGNILIGGTIRANDSVTITIDTVAYKYTVTASDTTDTVAKALTDMINGANGGTPDPKVTAYEEDGLSNIVLVARVPGTAGTSFTISTTLSTNASITAAPSGTTLNGASSANALAPGTLITIKAAPGQTFLDHTVTTDPNAQVLPWELDGVQVYIDGNRIPLLMASPSEINGQVPWEQVGSTSGSLVVRITQGDGSVIFSSAIGLEIHDAAPGIFACDPAGYPGVCAAGGQEPRVVSAVHSSDFATGTISIDGSIQAGDVATINIDTRTYSYTVVTGDTLASIRDNLINLINANPDEVVTASAAGQFTRVRLVSKIQGPEGNGTPISGSSSTATSNTQGVLIAVNATNSVMCCANVAGSLVTPDNPAVPGETIIILATGLGLVSPDEALRALMTGVAYNGPVANAPLTSVNATVAGATANVISAGAKVGTIGTYEVYIELSAGLQENPQTRMSISQFFQASNTVILPVGTNQ
jgi:uncharacterized protein (TIGR03437 family)